MFITTGTIIYLINMRNYNINKQLLLLLLFTFLIERLIYIQYSMYFTLHKYIKKTIKLK